MLSSQQKQLQKDIDALKTFKESLFGKGSSSEEPPATTTPYRSGKEAKADISPSAKPNALSSWFLEDKAKNPEISYVVNPLRHGNTVVPLRSSALCCYRIAQAIEGAQESIDIVTMGIDTDMRLIRNDLNQKNRILRYKRAYPAEPAERSDGAANKYSYVISDLLTRVSNEKHYDPVTHGERMPVKVRIIAGTPRAIGNSFFDPLHFWYRCKRFKGLINDPYKNITFVLRTGKGMYIKPPAHEEIDTSRMTFSETLQAHGVWSLDKLARLIAEYGPAYQGIFTHHQKIYLIDVEKENAQAFIIGSNMNEEYWDEPSHLLYNPLRLPYAPWRDAGLWVRGPVLHDIAKNIEDSWGVMLENDAEELPDELIAEGIRAERAGILREDDGLFSMASEPKHDFDFTLYQKIFSFAPYIGMALTPGGMDPVKLLIICGALATAIDMIGGLLNGTLLFDLAIFKKAEAWGGHYRNWDQYEPLPQNKKDPASLHHAVQFDRTFCQEKMDPDLSIVHGLYRGITKVGNNNLIYIENQYFRDTQLVELLRYLGSEFPDAWLRAGASPASSGKIHPYVIVVTALPDSTEKKLSQGPTFNAYKMLEASGVNFLFCRLRTKEHGPLKYSGNEVKFADGRSKSGMEERLLKEVLQILKLLLTISPQVLMLVHGRLRHFRDVFWAAVPTLLEDVRHGFGPTDGTPRPTIHTLAHEFTALDKLALVLLTVQKDKNELLKLAEKLRKFPDQKDIWLPQIIALLGGEGGIPPRPIAPEPLTSDQKAAEQSKHDAILKKLRQTCKLTPENIPVHEIPNDPGAIYVHTKAIIINSIFAMLGSANHNERSMWHDTEDMLAVGGVDANSFPGQLQKELLENVLSGDMPKSMVAKEVFLHFIDHLKENVVNYDQQISQRSLVFPYNPKPSLLGSFFLT